jgi:hypothetical protein
VTFFARAHSRAALCFQGLQRNRAMRVHASNQTRRKIRAMTCRNQSQTKFSEKPYSESQTTPIQPTFHTSKNEETKMAKKVKKVAKKAKKTKARKATRKPARKAARKTAKKAAKRKTAKRKTAKRRPARKARKAPAAAM